MIYYTARNFDLNRAPGLYDIRHVFRASGTYDLPFGKGKKFMNQGGLADRVFGGWTIGTITVLQSGSPVIMGGGYSTVNNSDAGVVFAGGTLEQLQSSVGARRSGNPWVQSFDPSYVGANGAASATTIVPQTTPGLWGYRPYVYSPRPFQFASPSGWFYKPNS